VSFAVDSPIFRGPIDLLLYLVRRHEVEVTEIMLASVTNEYLAYVEVLKHLSIDEVGDFLEVASMLVELKARALLPRNEFETEEEPSLADPRLNLVQRLLLYRDYRDVAMTLQDRAVDWQRRHARMADDLPRTPRDIADQPLHAIELWDLVSAFERVMRESVPTENANIVYDETPIHVYMQQIHARLVQHRRVSFTDLFEIGMHKSAMVSVFLAVLELARHHNVVTQQDDLYSELTIIPDEGFRDTLEVSGIDEYSPHQRSAEEDRSPP